MAVSRGRVVTVKGLKEVQRALKQLPAKVERKVLRTAIRAALKPLKAAVEMEAPRDSGDLAKSVRVRALKQRRRGVVALGVQIGDGWFRGETFYAAFVEYGTATIPANPFMARAFDANAESVKNDAVRRIREGVDEQVKALRGATK